MLNYVIRHSRLPAGNALWFCQNFLFLFIYLFFFIFFILPPPRFPDDNFWPPSQNLNRSHVMVTGRSASFSDPARPPGGGVGRPKHPKIPPPRKIFFCACVSEPQEHFWKKTNLVGNFFFFFGVLRPQEHFLAEIFVSAKNSTSPPPTCTPPPSPQNTDPNSRAIINNPNNCSMTYTL